jgi:sarcosine oxidase subunit gamma
MPETVLRASPLGDFPPTVVLDRNEAGVIFTERAFCGHINLRGNPDDAVFLAMVQRCIGTPLPTQPNTVSASASVTALWLGPDEWLLITPAGAEYQYLAALSTALEGLRFAATNITDGQTIIHLYGGRAIDVLRKGCSLDLHPRVFKPGSCAQTLIAKAGVLIRYVDQAPSFDLIVRRSFAEYLALWLKDAATEYGFHVV